MLFSKKGRREIRTIDLFEGYAREIHLIDDIRTLLKSLLRYLCEVAETRTASILLIDPERRSFLVRENVGGDPLTFHFSPHDPFLNYLGKNHQYLLKKKLLDHPHLLDVKEAGLQFMTAVHASVVFPLHANKKFLGVLCLGNTGVPQGYATDFLDHLEVLVSIAAISIDNATLYERISQQNRQLSEVAKLKTQFVATVSHELSTPLNGILGLIEVLRDPETSGPLTDDQRRYIQMIRDAAGELDEIVQQVIELTRFQNQSAALEVKRLDVRKIAEEVFRDLEPLFLQKGIRFFPPESAMVAYGDEGQIRQVLLSLFENALKFSGDKVGNCVRLRAERRGDMLQVLVEDRGMGIAEEDQMVVFEEFRQLEGVLERSQGGTGLGLALVRKIVELHGGRIWVESKKGEGTQFFFTLPTKPGMLSAETHAVAFSS